MSDASTQQQVVLTCAQPTGKLHLGNYLGAVRNWTRYLDGYECYFGIVDLHAITVPYVPADLRRDTMECIAQYIACGIDPDKANIFVQSHIIGHTELAWILSCLCPLGQLERMTQFKDKSAKARSEDNQAFIGSGLLQYPVLMAADILLYNADIVPVGEDQKQHLELTRDLAQKFNFTYSETFKVPDLFIPKTGARIMSLQNPTKKMSKSDENQTSTLYITDDEKTIRKKIGSAVTDSDSGPGCVRASDDKPGVTNLLGILGVATGKSVEELEKEFAEASYKDFKDAVADAVAKMLAPVREKYEAVVADKKYLTEVIKRGDDAAQKRAFKMLGKVQRKAGFVAR
ncbi:tryptophan--tRNA ligase [Cerasicoccus maritimus]|uniref:tryptophan--tRNA ligase n=1 Tax=Cerasicoccus maritimus TaxID=490089 RepID=UPI0028525303|nr:tryptophan--tRNA ligase [Cerasicoccus maritimus]